ncbi:MAG: hypothetical protein AAF355_11510 [Myxococcota bacterium]
MAIGIQIEGKIDWSANLPVVERDQTDRKDFIVVTQAGKVCLILRKGDAIGFDADAFQIDTTRSRSLSHAVVKRAARYGDSPEAFSVKMFWTEGGRCAQKTWLAGAFFAS